MTYEFLQSYWWFLVSLLGALLVFLMFVQGANTLIFCLGKTEEERRLIINSTGRKWEFTFTTLVTFGGAFFASFPLFYSTSFGGAYWLWMIILFSFVIQAVSYEFQNKIGNFLGPKTFQICLIINGIVGPLLLGGAVATFFNGSNFLIDKGNITNSLQPVISRWANASHGLDALLDPWNVVLGLAVLMLARILGMLYIKNNIEHQQIQERCTRQLPWNALLFLLFFLPFLIRLMIKDGFSTSSSGITIESMKYLNNLLEMPILSAQSSVLLERISGLQEASSRSARSDAAYRPSQTSRVMTRRKQTNSSLAMPGMAQGREAAARYTPTAVHMRWMGTAKLRSRMGVPLKCHLRASSAGMPFLLSQRRTSHAASRMSSAHPARAASANQPSSSTEPNSNERSRIEKIMITS